MIPSCAHFIWFGKDLFWPHVIALKSAAERGGFSKVILHHDASFANSAEFSLLKKTLNIELRQLNPFEELEKTDDLSQHLIQLYQRLQSPVSRANIIRVVILHNEGGVYLDTDTITLRSFEPLLDAGVFCGFERIALPGSLIKSRRLGALINTGFKLLARDVCRRAPHGWRSFRRIEKLYPACVNNAVFGAEKGHLLTRELLQRMVELPEKAQLVRYALGTHLFQEVIANCSYSDLVVHPPQLFYPLGPEISQHWFRSYPPQLLAEIVTPETICVHWYSSVRTAKIIPKIDRDYILAHSETQFFSALAQPFCLKQEEDFLKPALWEKLLQQ